MGCGGPPETAAFMEITGWDTKRNPVRRFHRHSGFRRAIARKDSDRIGCWVPANQGEGETWLGCECAGENSLALVRHRAQLRRQLGVYLGRGRASPEVRSV